MERLELFGKICECGGNIVRWAFMINKPFACEQCHKAYSHDDLKYIETKPIPPEFQEEMKQLLKEHLGIE